MQYDLIIVGGGLAGSSLAKVMAEAGASTLVLERDEEFRDRVRGEGMHPWGVAEARRLGIVKPLRNHCGHQLRWWYFYDDDLSIERRDLIQTTPHRAGILSFYHPEMQETLLQAAQAAGAEVRRGATVIDITPGAEPAVQIKKDGKAATCSARLVVGADGRRATSRSYAGFQVKRDPEQQIVASVLVEDLQLDDDAAHIRYSPAARQFVIIFPLGARRFRIYFVYRLDGKRRGLSGSQQVANFFEACIGAGTPAAWYAQARPVGPLAEFSAAATWIDHPYTNGVALVGDAAGAVDPSWGCGLALTLRDVRVLSQALLADDDWDAAAHRYAAAHDQYFGDLHRIEQWYSLLYYEPGEEAAARRERAFSMERQNIPDIVGLGPESPCDEAAKRRFFGEE